MTRRRLAALALVATLAGGGVVSTPVARAAPADPPATLDLTARERYWACIALEQVDVGTCLENPLPDLGQVSSLADLLGRRGATR